MVYIKTFSMLLLIAIMGTSCTSQQDSTVVFWVNSIKVECDAGAGKLQCLQIYEGDYLEHAQWSYFYTPIEGFTFQPGYFQKIEVSKNTIETKHVPADAASIQYKLIQVVEKKQDPTMKLHDIWAATHINGNSIETNNVPTLEINRTKMMVFGTDGCNNYTGSITSLNENKITLGPLATTRKICKNMEIPNAYNKALHNTVSYNRKNGTLYFYNANNNETLRLKKID